MGANGTLEAISTGPIDVTIASRPRVTTTAKPNAWALDWGCQLFIYGSAITVVLLLYDMLEDFLSSAWFIKFWFRTSDDLDKPNAGSNETAARQAELLASATRPHGSLRTEIFEKVLY